MLPQSSSSRVSGIARRVARFVNGPSLVVQDIAFALIRFSRAQSNLVLSSKEVLRAHRKPIFSSVSPRWIPPDQVEIKMSTSKENSYLYNLPRHVYNRFASKATSNLLHVISSHDTRTESVSLLSAANGFRALVRNVPGTHMLVSLAI